MAELYLRNETASVVIDPERGGRLASLEVHGLQLLVIDGELGPLQWGSYPMVPWAGRVHHGRFAFAGTSYELPCNLPPHAAHGTGFTSSWAVLDDHTISLELGPPWPFDGTVRQLFELDESGLTMTIVLQAEVAMPAMVGWHPWFRRFLDGDRGPVEAGLSFGPAMMYELDDAAIPTGSLVSPPVGPWDNCFTALVEQPVIEWPGLVTLRLSSSCDHWVIYTEPEYALCVEPQSAAPDEFNRGPTVIEAGQEMRAWFRLDWT